MALTPVFPLVLSPGFEPGPDSSLDCRLYRLGYESVTRATRRDMPARSTIDPAALCRITAPMPAVDAHTAAWGMTWITGCAAHAPPRPFPHPVGRLTRDAVAHVSGNLSALGGIG